MVQKTVESLHGPGEPLAYCILAFYRIVYMEKYTRHGKSCSSDSVDTQFRESLAITFSTVRFKFSVNIKRIITSGHLRKTNKKEKLIKSYEEVRNNTADNLNLITFCICINIFA